MAYFEKSFGAGKSRIRKDCVILPSNDVDLFKDYSVSKISSGMFYDIWAASGFTVIRVKYRAFAGDCVLALEDTVCENIFLFGSCGVLSGSAGDRFICETSHNMESFSSLLKISDLKEAEEFHPDEGLLSGFFGFAGRDNIKSCSCATVSSLVLERTKSDFFKESGIECVDMESSMVYSAAELTGKKALALFYAADIVNDLNFYDDYSRQVREKIKGARKSLADRLGRFITSHDKS